ncbi:FAS-associated death domain [Paramuricea clavata]|uniref:FAS-associated death domain n=1 Tax=Paramuricea clavata TaxID=317549 RepID=A0A7D9EH90_PARCT|nr:FAS-associated death domain [Paramuricea clavata]
MEKFNVLLQKISRDLNPNDLEDLVHICRIEKSRKPTITSGHHLFTHLRHNRRISEENVDYLKEVLNAIHRHDLVSLVERFEGLETTDVHGQIVNVKSEPSTDMSPVSITPFNQRNFVNHGVENIQRLSAVCDDGCQIQIAGPGRNESDTSLKCWKRRQDNAVIFSTANTPVSTEVAADFAKNEDPGPSVVLQINPSCEDEMNDEPTTCGSYIGNIITTGDTEPILSQESES